jgi:hypothetical protein
MVLSSRHKKIQPTEISCFAINARPPQRTPAENDGLIYNKDSPPPDQATVGQILFCPPGKTVRSTVHLGTLTFRSANSPAWPNTAGYSLIGAPLSFIAFIINNNAILVNNQKSKYPTNFFLKAHRFYTICKSAHVHINPNGISVLNMRTA